MGMRSFARRLTAAATLLVSPGAARGQATPPAHLLALAVPPDSVGTCLALPQVDARGWQGRQLVMTSRTPSGRRALTIYVDSAGRVARYAEQVSTFNGVDAGTGGSVVAALGADGAWHGFRTAVTTRLVNGGRGADGRRMLPPPVRATAGPRRALTATEQRRVRDLAAWVRTRCRA